MGAIELTESQSKWLTSISDGPSAMPIMPFSKLRALGLVEKAEGGSGRRGYTMAQLTSAGRSQLAG